jgi:hypothetical protein
MYQQRFLLVVLPVDMSSWNTPALGRPVSASERGSPPISGVG